MKNADVGKLASRAFLLKLTKRFWQMKVQDQTITEDANKKWKSDGNYNKSLVPLEALRACRVAHNAVDRRHDELTVPWTDDGWRLILAANMLDYEKEINILIAEANKSADELADNWDALVKERKQNDKSFNPDHYPSKQEMREKYGFKFRSRAIPTSNDIRIKLSDDALAMVKESMLDQTIKDEQTAGLEAAVMDITKRITDVVGNLSQTLKNYKPPKKGKGRAEGDFHSSLVENVKKVGDLLPKINVTANPKIDKMAQEMISKLAAFDSDQLKGDEKARKKVIKEADQILSKVNDFF